jgi:PKD repeat protein
MTFDSSANWWRGNETYLLLWDSGGHPGNVADAIRQWVAPQAGSIRITGNASDLDASCGAGAMVYIRKNSVGAPPSVQTFSAPAAGPVYLTTGPNGDIFYADFGGGTIRRFTYAVNQPPTAVAQATPLTGSAPLTVTFDGSASTDPDAGDTITYAWDLDADGQFDDSTAAQPSFTYTINGGYQVRLRVTDNHGASSTASVVITVGSPNAPPIATIDTPAATLVWTVGSPISFSGHAIDQQDGVLPASALSWKIILHHCPSNCHTHPVTDFVGVASGSFNAPDHDYPSHLEIQLTATDSQGLTDVKSVLIFPQTVSVGFESVPSGLQLTVGSSNSITPFSRTVIVASQNSVSAASPQSLNGSTYQFISWSDGGAQSHIITASAAATYTATYELTTSITYQASADFSSTQGFRNWFYLYGAGTPMTFDSAANWWRGNEAFLLLWGDGGHPGNAGDAIRRWVAPQAGSIRITGNAIDLDAACGAGVTLYIKKNAFVLWQQTLTNGSSATFDLTTTVLQGDGVDFGINRGPDGVWNCDTTAFDPTIVFTPGAPPPPPPPPPGSTTYQASTDFSTTQGFRNRFYLYGAGTPMTFDSAANRWRGNEAIHHLWDSGGHPGNAPDAIRRWVAPQAGSIHITGNAIDLDATCGGGVALYIRKNGLVLWQQTLTNGSSATVDLTTTVLQGEGIDFGINRGAGGWNCDTTAFDPTIVFTPN